MAQKFIRRFKCPSCAIDNTLRNSKPRNSKEKLLQLTYLSLKFTDAENVAGEDGKSISPLMRK